MATSGTCPQPQWEILAKPVEWDCALEPRLCFSPFLFLFAKKLETLAAWPRSCPLSRLPFLFILLTLLSQVSSHSDRLLAWTGSAFLLHCTSLRPPLHFLSSVGRQELDLLLASCLFLLLSCSLPHLLSLIIPTHFVKRQVSRLPSLHRLHPDNCIATSYLPRLLECGSTAKPWHSQPDCRFLASLRCVSTSLHILDASSLSTTSFPFFALHLDSHHRHLIPPSYCPKPATAGTLSINITRTTLESIGSSFT